MSIVKPLIVITGPTASGKTEIALKLAKKFNGEIISADSRQIYKEINIGTAKPTKEQRELVPHHLIDVANPDKEITLSQYKKMAIKKIEEIHSKNKLPFLVGGTGLYIQAIVDNLSIPKVKPDPEIREKLEKMSLEELNILLKKIDSKTFEKIDNNNKRRLVRALEVCIKTKKPFSEQTKKGNPLFNCLQIGIKINKEKLEKKINKRVEEMINNGLIEEVKSLAKKYSTSLPSMNGIGYQEIITYLNTELNTEFSVDEINKIKELIKIHTRQYAKRQMTWFKRDKRINWIENYEEAEKLINNFISR